MLPDLASLYNHPELLCALQPVVRKQHNAGYKHKANARNYFLTFEESQTQNMIESKVKEYEERSRIVSSKCI